MGAPVVAAGECVAHARVLSHRGDSTALKTLIDRGVRSQEMLVELRGEVFEDEGAANRSWETFKAVMGELS